jgi:hypothetical protein
MSIPGGRARRRDPSCDSVGAGTKWKCVSIPKLEHPPKGD